MSEKSTLVKTMQLQGTSKGILTVSHITEPYGENSAPVVSLGVSLSGNESQPDWKVHIPVDQIEEVCRALQEAKANL